MLAYLFDNLNYKLSISLSLNHKDIRIIIYTAEYFLCDYDTGRSTCHPADPIQI